MKKLTLGVKVKDHVTGFTGIIIGRTEWLTGCTTYGVQPELDKDGKYVESKWFDEDRLLIVAVEPVMPPASQDTGGPKPVPQRNEAPGR